MKANKTMQKNKLTERTTVGLHKYLIESIPETIPYDTPILDLGCGSGAWLERLANAGFNNLYGIDYDVRQFATSKAISLQANLDFDNHLSFENKKFGLITAIEVIEHLQNPGRLFVHVSNLLEPDGYFLLTTPNLHSITCKLRYLVTGNLRQFDRKGDPTHIYPVFLTPLKRTLQFHGLEIVKQWTIPPNTSVTSKALLKAISSLLSLAIQNELPGDNLCLLIRKVKITSTE